MALQEGQNMGQYRILAQLGQGGMATVYKAYHPKLDRYVAIKMVHQAFLEDPAFISRFEREAQIVASLEHNHIVPVYDYAEYNGQPYLVMKYIEGRTLKAELAHTPLTLARVGQIMRQVGSALDYAHARGILHRDIKPSNIVIDNSGTSYLTDFGLARIARMGESTLSHDMLLGTPHYISPEQAMGRRDIDHRADLYSLGVILYEMVVGRVPFSADTPYAVIHDHIYRALPLPSTVNPELPASVEEVLLKALAKTPGDRFPTATAMIDAFEGAAREAGLTELNPERAEIASESLARLREGDQTMTPPQPLPSIQSPATRQPGLVIPPVVPPVPPQPSFNPQRPQSPQLPSFLQPPPVPGGEKRKNDREQGRAVEIERDEHGRPIELRLSLEDAGKTLSEAGKQVAQAFKNTDWEQSKWNPEHWFDNEDIPSDDDVSLRQRIEKQHKKRTEFMSHAAVYTVINAMLWIIYGTAGGPIQELANDEVVTAAMDFPWPLIVMFGWGSGLVAHALETYYSTGARAARSELAVRQEMARLYGRDWAITADKDSYNTVRRRVQKPFKKRAEFAQHLGVYVMINCLMWIIYGAGSDIFTAIAAGDPDLASIAGFPWPLIVMFGWGAGLVAHAADTFINPAHNGKREEAIQREIERERERLNMDGYTLIDKPKNDFNMRLTEDGELTDSIAQEWNVDEERRRGRR